MKIKRRRLSEEDKKKIEYERETIRMIRGLPIKDKARQERYNRGRQVDDEIMESVQQSARDSRAKDPEKYDAEMAEFAAFFKVKKK